jgi:hypothetical protein
MIIGFYDAIGLMIWGAIFLGLMAVAFFWIRGKKR